MLTVCLHKLCPKDSFANAFRKVEHVQKLSLGERKTAPGWFQSGLLEALGRQLDGRSEGGSWAALGASRGAPGALLGPPLFLVSPCEIAKTSKFVDSTALFEVFRGPGGSKIGPESLRKRSQARLGFRGVWRPRGAVLRLSGPFSGPSAWLLGRPWVAPGRSEITATRAPHIKSSPKTV